MSLNKFMHPRNRYRKPPDFKALAIKYPEFRNFAKQDITGKVSLNFKDLEAIRALTRTLLLEDFNLDVEIPLNRLVPTLPLRLNYLLWIEDLLESNKRTSDIRGIDIGCGASCVYPLLAAKQFGWKMVATEVDMESAFIAGRNVKKNKLQDLIRVRTVKENNILEDVLEPGTTYDFCMCNPPFFSSVEELDPKNVSRSPNRPAPRNAHSGSTTELVAPGGETAFVTGIVRDSCKLKGVIRIYSVMLGHKTSVAKVKQVLQEADVPSASVVTSEFCQGRTTRWGVAWTLDPSITLPQLSYVCHGKKKIAPIRHTFQSDLKHTVDTLKKLLEELQTTFKILKDNPDVFAMEITALENTWSNSRQKRRQEKLKQMTTETTESTQGNDNLEEKPRENGKLDISDVSESGENNSEKESGKGDNLVEMPRENSELVKSVVSGSGENNSEKENGQEKIIEKCEIKAEPISSESEVVLDQKSQTGSKRKANQVESDPGTSEVKKPKLENPASDSRSEGKSKKEPILRASLVTKKCPEGCLVELAWLGGAGGKDSVHQLLQHLKNNFKPH